jgi:hypothetical protein
VTSRSRKPGLLHGPERWEIEDVSPRHGTPCSNCGKAPQIRRLLIVRGSGRFSGREVLCDYCARSAIEGRQEVLARALAYLAGEADSVRPPPGKTA